MSYLCVNIKFNKFVEKYHKTIREGVLPNMQVGGKPAIRLGFICCHVLIQLLDWH